MLLSQQIPATTPGWVGPTMAISLAVVALAFVVIAAVAALVARQAARTLARLQTDLAPALTALQGIVQDGHALTTTVKDEASALMATSRQLRGQVEAGAERLRDRLANLEALYDVVEEEVEETALDLTAALRTVRTGAGWFAPLRRLLRRGRRR
jgi:hypothetical protein